MMPSRRRVLQAGTALLGRISQQPLWSAGILMLGGLVMGKVLSMGNNILLARSLHSKDFGLLTLGLSVFELANVPAGLGVASLLPKYIAESLAQDQKGRISDLYSLVIGSCFTLAAGMASLIMLSSYTISNTIFHQPELTRVLIILASTMPFSVGTSMVISLFRGYQQTRPKILFQDFLLPSLRIALYAVLFWLGYGLAAACYAFALSNLLIFVGSVIAASILLNVKLRPRIYDSILTPEIFHLAWPLSLQSLVYIIYSQIDRICLGTFLSPSQVGIYGAAYTLTSMLVIIPGAFNYLALPLFAKTHSQNNSDEIRAAYQKIGRAVFQISLPVLIIILVFAPQFLRVLYGAEYIGAAGALSLLCLGSFADAVFGPASDALVASGNTRIPLFAALAGCISNVILNVWLIPLLGIMGAAVATCMSMYLSKSIMAVSNYRQYRIIAISHRYLVYILMSGLTAFIIKHVYHATAFGNDMIRILGLSAFYLFSTYCMFFAWNRITSKTAAVR